MGFFDWVMHGLGFETTEKKKGKKTKTLDPDDKYANFNLHEKIGETEKLTQNSVSSGFSNFGIQTESNIIMVEPKSYSEIQQCVDYLKQGQSVAVNLEGLSFDDIKAKYEGKGYGDFKSDLAEIVANEVGMVQEKFNYWFNSEELDRVLNEGKMKAEYLASKKMAKIKKKFGYGR